MIEMAGGGWGGLFFAIAAFVMLYETLMSGGGMLLAACLKDEKAKNKTYDWAFGRLLCCLPGAVFMMFFALFKIAEGLVK